MTTLDLFKSRRFNLVKFSNGKEYKIPDEYTVEEVERLLELKKKQEELSHLPVAPEEADKEAQLDIFWTNIFNQLEIVFQSFQPEIDVKYLKKNITHKEALEIVGFFQEYRALALDKMIAQSSTEPKKKLN